MIIQDGLRRTFGLLLIGCSKADVRPLRSGCLLSSPWGPCDQQALMLRYQSWDRALRITFNALLGYAAYHVAAAGRISTSSINKNVGIGYFWPSLRLVYCRHWFRHIPLPPLFHQSVLNRFSPDYPTPPRTSQMPRFGWSLDKTPNLLFFLIVSVLIPSCAFLLAAES